MTPINENKITRDLERQKTTDRLRGAGVNVGKMPKFLRNTVTDKLSNLLDRRQARLDSRLDSAKRDGREEEAGYSTEDFEADDEAEDDGQFAETESIKEGQSESPIAKSLDRQKAQDALKSNKMAGGEGGPASPKPGDGGAIKGGFKLGAQMGTAKALFVCWRFIYFVLPLIYIDFHGIMRYVFKSEYFCRYGEEWQGGGKGAAAAGGKLKTSGTGAGSPPVGGLAKQAGGALELLEIWAVVLCNLIVLAAIFICLVYIYYMTHPLEAAKVGLQAIGDLFKDLFK